MKRLLFFTLLLPFLLTACASVEDEPPAPAPATGGKADVFSDDWSLEGELQRCIAEFDLPGGPTAQSYEGQRICLEAANDEYQIWVQGFVSGDVEEAYRRLRQTQHAFCHAKMAGSEAGNSEDGPLLLAECLFDTEFDLFLISERFIGKPGAGDGLSERQFDRWHARETERILDLQEYEVEFPECFESTAEMPRTHLNECIHELALELTGEIAAGLALYGRAQALFGVSEEEEDAIAERVRQDLDAVNDTGLQLCRYFADTDEDRGRNRSAFSGSCATILTIHRLERYWRVYPWLGE